MTDDLAALRAVVQGRVQGVGFRFFVQDTASALGLTGYVRNLSNGNLEVVAEGPRPSLEALLRELHRGPALSRVGHVGADWGDPTLGYTGFVIR